MISILNIEPEDYCAQARSILETLGTVNETELDHSKLLEVIGNYEVLIVRLAHKIDREIIERATKLKVIISATTGLDHIDLEAASQNNIRVLSLKGETEFLSSITATAELSWGLLLALIRHIPDASNDVHEGNWQRDIFKGAELKGRTLGILGYGRLGRWIARYGLAFGMQVLVHDVQQGTPESGIVAVDFHALLSSSDILSVHLPLDASTTGLLNQDAFMKMQVGSYLINTSRGGIVDEDALLNALKNGHLAGAALDVIDHEKQGFGTMKTHPLVAYSEQGGNVIITPHIGGATRDAMKQTEIFMAKKLQNFLKNADAIQ